MITEWNIWILWWDNMYLICLSACHLIKISKYFIQFSFSFFPICVCIEFRTRSDKQEHWNVWEWFIGIIHINVKPFKATVGLLSLMMLPWGPWGTQEPALFKTENIQNTNKITKVQTSMTTTNFLPSPFHIHCIKMFLIVSYCKFKCSNVFVVQRVNRKYLGTHFRPLRLENWLWPEIRGRNRLSLYTQWLICLH